MTNINDTLLNVIGGVYKAPSVSAQPDVRLYRWAVYRAMHPDGEMCDHLVGSSNYDRGRVSTAIVEKDFTNRVFITRSGRKYSIEGEPGIGMDASYVWSVWSQGLKDILDVTEEYATSVKNACSTQNSSDENTGVNKEV